MFETKKTLIVVYKDELLMNQLKKMVETHDDNDESVVGTRDNSINIVSWTESVWLGNKKAGNIQGKILFLDDIKGTDQLIPVIDTVFDDCGVKYGWGGNQAVLYADTKALTKREDYDDFLQKLSDLPVPSFLKTAKENITATGTDAELESETAESIAAVETSDEDKKTDKKSKKFDLLKAARGVVEAGADVIGKVGNQVATTSEEVFRNRQLMKRQMLFYGVVHLYNDGLETFMNM